MRTSGATSIVVTIEEDDPQLQERNNIGTELRTELFNLINQERVTRGKDKLTEDWRVLEAANEKALGLSNGNSDTMEDNGGRTPADYLEERGVNSQGMFSFFGNCVLEGKNAKATAEKLFDMIKEDPRLYDRITTEDFTKLGVSIVLEKAEYNAPIFFTILAAK